MQALKLKNNWLFIAGLVIIFAISLSIRFWGLDRFYYLVFDEDHYVPHAYGYLTNQTNFVQDIHPPLGRYLIAVSMWLDFHNPFTHHDKSLPATLFTTPESFRQAFQKESLVNPFSYRWLTAFCGALIPLFISGIAYQLTKKRSLTLVAGSLAMLDGYFIIESRFALINIFLVLFSLIGCYSVLSAVNSQGNWRNLWLAIAGIFFGCSICVKWSGLWFMFGVFFTILLVWLLLINKAIQVANSNVPPQLKYWRSWLNWFSYSLQHLRQYTNHSVPALSQITIPQLIIYLGIIPVVTYTLLWIPHLPLNQEMSFIDRHKWILDSHLVSAPDGHPNCSRWYQWLFATAPVGYYLRHYDINTPQENITIMQGYGNPIVWWLSTVALGGITIFCIYQFVDIILRKQEDKLNIASHVWLLFYVGINYWANILPWVFVKRCTFQYHYLPAYCFAIIGLAWFVDILLTHKRTLWRTIASLILLASLLAFQFWLPIFIGLPLSAQDYETRIWLPSWHEGWVFTKDRMPAPSLANP